MWRALVFSRIAGDAEFVERVLTSAGWSVQAAVGRELDVSAAAGVDLVVAALNDAIAVGWARRDHPVAPPAPLVVMSRFGAFLSDLPPTVKGVIHLPATAEAILTTVQATRADRLGPAGTEIMPGAPGPSAAPSPRAPAETTRPEPFGPRREAELVARGLIGGAPDPELSAIAALVARGLGVPIGLVTAVGSGWQEFLGQYGLPDDLAIANGTVRSWSFCQHAVRESSALVVEDARQHPVVRDSPLVDTGLIGAYAGVPIEVEGIGAVGTVCALSDRPRAFGEGELSTLQIAARLAGQILSVRPRREGASVPPPAGPAPLAVGDRVGDQYWITAMIGEGAQGRVFLARDRVVDRVVAIKLAPRDLEAMLLGEAGALGKLRHPNILQLYGWGRAPSGEVYLVLEYVPGETLQRRIEATVAAGGTMPSEQVDETVRQLAGALSTMHAHGYVHGDMKPENILLDPALARAVLIDFGIVLRPRSLDASGPAAMGGTPGFSAPEQFAHEGPIDPRPSFDVYALGAVTFTMLTGLGPFEGGGVSPLMRQLHGASNRLSDLRPDLPGEVASLLAGALSVDPGARPASPLAFAEALHHALRAKGAPAPRPPVPLGPRSRRAAFRLLRAEVAHLIGAEAEAAVFAHLPATDRAAFAPGPDDALIPAAPLIAYLRAAGEGDPLRLRDLGSRHGAVALRDALREFRISCTPEAVLGAADLLLRRFHTWADVRVERESALCQHVHLQLPDGFAPLGCTYLGATLRGVLGATGRNVTVEQRSCKAGGQGECVLVARWSALEG